MVSSSLVARHLETLGGIPFHRLYQPTIFRIAQDDDFAAVAALTEGIAGIEHEALARLTLGSTMAGVTLRGQNGPDVLLKKLWLAIGSSASGNTPAGELADNVLRKVKLG